MTPRRPKAPPPLFALEANVMREVWRHDEVTVRQVLEALNRGKRKRAYTTIMTTMVRLDEKGVLARRRQGRTDFYSATMSRDEYLARRAQCEVGALVDRFGDLALAHFARQVEQLDPKRLEQLRRLAGRD